MLNPPVESAELETVLCRQVRKISIRHFLRDLGFRVQRSQVVGNPFDAAFGAKLPQTLARLFHRVIERFPVTADAQKAQPRDGTKHKLLACEPGKGDRVLWVTRPNASQEHVHVEEVFHGNSSRASRITCSLTGCSETPTVYPFRFSNLTRLGRGLAGSSLVRTYFPSSRISTSKRSPGLAWRRVTRCLLSAMAVI